VFISTECCSFISDERSNQQLKWRDSCFCCWCCWAYYISTTVCLHSTHSFSCLRFVSLEILHARWRRTTLDYFVLVGACNATLNYRRPAQKINEHSTCLKGRPHLRLPWKYTVTRVLNTRQWTKHTIHENTNSKN